MPNTLPSAAKNPSAPTLEKTQPMGKIKGNVRSQQTLLRPLNKSAMLCQHFILPVYEEGALFSKTTMFCTLDFYALQNIAWDIVSVLKSFICLQFSINDPEFGSRMTPKCCQSTDGQKLNLHYPFFNALIVTFRSKGPIINENICFRYFILQQGLR